MKLSTPIPFQEAVGQLAGKQIIPSDLSSLEWSGVPQQLRDRAFFSARVTNAQFLQGAKDKIDSILNPRTVQRTDRVTPDNPEGFVTEGINPATARAELKQLLQEIGYQPDADKRGTIQDLSSDRRLNLIIKTNLEMAQGYGGWLQGQDPAVLRAYPAQELFRLEDRKEPRDWLSRWQGAGGRLFGGRMIALKSDSVWTEISAFGNPYPPFDFNSGMWVRPVARQEAMSLGLAVPDSQPSTLDTFNSSLQSSVEHLDEDLQEALRISFGDLITIVKGVAKWVS